MFILALIPKILLFIHNILFLSFLSNVPSLCYILTVILKVLVLNVKFDFWLYFDFNFESAGT